MPYVFIPVTKTKYILGDIHGRIYNYTPKSKKELQKQIRAIEASKHNRKK